MSTGQVDKERKKNNPLRSGSFWLVAIAVTSLLIGVLSVTLAYLALRPPEPGVAFETISETNVLDLRRPLQDLSIVFRGQNVQEGNLNLRIVTINVANIGDVDILPSHYDYEDDWGIRFNDGKVIEARLLDANSNYLQSKIVPRSVGEDTVIFPKVIFEKDDFFVIEVLLLHSKNDSPSIASVGKIAGIDEITVVTRPLARQEIGFAKELFRGSGLVQISRAILYFVGSLLTIGVWILFAIVIEEAHIWWKKHRNRNRIKRTRTFSQMDQNDSNELLVSHYTAGGTVWLKELREMIREPQKLKWITPDGHWGSLEGHSSLELSVASGLLDMDSIRFSYNSTLSQMTAIGILKRGENDSALIDATFADTVEKLVSELEEN